jgi:hypothetical protein
MQTILVALLIAAQTPAPRCEIPHPEDAIVVSTQQEAISIAKIAWSKQFSAQSIKRHEPYKATLKEGTWFVFGTLPKGWRGGTAEAFICQKTGKVVKIQHTR